MSDRDAGLRKIFRKNLPQVDWQAVELGALGSGVPDSNFCHDGVEGWIEFKKLTKNQIGLRPEQIGWIKSRIRHGGLIKIVVRAEDLGDMLLIFDGSMVVDLESKSLNENMHHVRFHRTGGPKLWEWSEVLRMIKERVE
jgi:hypothetical protein